MVKSMLVESMKNLFAVPKYVPVDSKYLEEAVSSLLGNSEYRLLITTNLCPDFYIHPTIKDSIEQAAKRRVGILMLLDPKSDMEKVTYIKELQKSGRILIRRSRVSQPHMIIVDDIHIFLEGPHPPSEKSTEPAIIYDTVLAVNRKNWFSNRWEEGEEVCIS